MPSWTRCPSLPGARSPGPLWRRASWRWSGAPGRDGGRRRPRGAPPRPCGRGPHGRTRRPPSRGHAPQTRRTRSRRSSPRHARGRCRHRRRCAPCYPKCQSLPFLDWCASGPRAAPVLRGARRLDGGGVHDGAAPHHDPRLLGPGIEIAEHGSAARLGMAAGPHQGAPPAPWHGRVHPPGGAPPAWHSSSAPAAPGPRSPSGCPWLPPSHAAMHAPIMAYAQADGLICRLWPDLPPAVQLGRCVSAGLH